LKKKLKRQRLTHQIKASGLDFSQVEDNSRKFIIATDDKKEGYEIGDIIIIQRSINRKGTGEFIERKISSIQRRGDGLMQGSVVLGLEDLKSKINNP